jgi:hypothetical protein
MAALLVGIPGSLFAQGTDEQREACMPDAFRLCMSAMPDAGRVENCLRNAGPQLSSACYAVFYPPAPVNQTQVARGQAPSARSPMSAHAQAPAPRTQARPPAPANDDD